MTKGNVLIIGDTHIPFEKKKYLEFCKSVQKLYKCRHVVHIGDLVDNHAISFHDTDPDGLAGGKEAEIARKRLRAWIKAFPTLKICEGNHDRLHYRKAFSQGIPKIYMRNYNEIFDLPKTWLWAFKFEHEGVRYLHGTGKGGMYAHKHWAEDNMQSTVIGHTHTSLGVCYMASDIKINFGMQVGCGIDAKAYAMQYASVYSKKPTIGCGVVLEGGRDAIAVPMKL